MRTRLSLLSRIFGALLALVLLAATAAAQESGAIHGSVFTLGPDGQPTYLPGATMVLTCAKEPGSPESRATDGTGRFTFLQVAPGACTLEASAEGFLSESRSLQLVDSNVVEVNLELKLAPVKADVTVSANAGPDIDTTTTSAAAPALTQRALESAPLVNERFQDALPLLPGVVRGPDGLIDVKGARPTQSGTLVNDASAIDPVTGQAAISLPIEAVETVKVLSNPYAPEYGRFAGGVTQLETRSGTDQWNVLFTNFFPRLRRRDGHFLGLESVTPRLTFAGPLSKGKLYLFQSFDYRFVRVPVESLPPLERDQEFESFDSHTQFDWNINAYHHLSGTFSLYPQNIRYWQLNTFNPQEVSPNFRQRGYQISLNERALVGGGLLESVFSVKRYDVHVFPSGGVDGELNLFPERNSGAWFNREDRNSWFYQWSQIYRLPAIEKAGQHLLSFGYFYEHASYDGGVTNQPVVVLREDGTTSQRIAFSGPAQLSATTNNFAFFAADHWSLAPRFTLDYGVRFDHDGISNDTLNVAPRIGFVFAPTADNKTAIRGGVGLFYDKIPLGIATFPAYPAETVTRFDASGQAILGMPLVFAHQVITPDGMHVPYSVGWNFQVDREIRSGLLLRFGYEQRRTYRDFFVQPFEGVNGSEAALQLFNTGRQTYREFQWTVRWQPRERTTVFASYVRSRARGELNNFSQFFGDHPSPIFRPNEFGPLPFDAPNRFLLWGNFSLPWKLEFWPVLDIHDGFPFSRVDNDLNFVGARNEGGRYPTFASFDFQLIRTFEVKFLGKKRELRAGFKMFNFANHFNPRDVQNNLGSPNFGGFYNGVGRQFRAKFEFKF